MSGGVWGRRSLLLGSALALRRRGLRPRSWIGLWGSVDLREKRMRETKKRKKDGI